MVRTNQPTSVGFLVCKINFIKSFNIVKYVNYTMSMSTTILDVPKECSQIAILINGNVLMFNSTRQAEKFCVRMRLRITGQDKQGSVYLINAQREDNTL